MTGETRKRIYFALYIAGILVMAVIYFFVPERSEFLQKQFEWWREFWDVLFSG